MWQIGGMTTTIFIAVIFAAVLHASWNALVKSGADKELNLAAVILGHAPIALVFMIIMPLPAPASWPYIFAGLFFHFGYQLFLLASYKIGDLTQVYPIARGSAPLLVAGISVVFLGVHLTSLELLAICIIAAGILSLALVRQKDGIRNTRAALLAFITGCFIAGYSLIDGLGARLAETALGFYGWLGFGNAVIFAIFFAIKRPSLLPKVLSEGRNTFIIGGTASYVAFSIVIWAFTQAPIALVTALRETSIIFALLFGVFFLKERLDLVKVISTMLTLLGAMLLRFSKN